MSSLEVPPYNGVKTVEKSLRILELLLAAQEGLGISYIAAQTGMPRASAHRLLTTLHALGWVERPASRPIFRISLRLYALAHVFVRNYGLLQRLQPLLTELSLCSRETVHLGVLDGWKCLVIGREDSPERVGIGARVGGRGWAHTSSLGKALLAGQSDTFLQAYIAATGLPGMTENSITTPEAFWAEIAIIRRQGFSVDDEEDSIGVHCIGATLPTVYGPALLGVSIAGPSTRFTLEKASQFAPLLLDLVRRAGDLDGIPVDKEGATEETAAS